MRICFEGRTFNLSRLAIGSGRLCTEGLLDAEHDICTIKQSTNKPDRRILVTIENFKTNDGRTDLSALGDEFKLPESLTGAQFLIVEDPPGCLDWHPVGAAD